MGGDQLVCHMASGGLSVVVCGIVLHLYTAPAMENGHRFDLVVVSDLMHIVLRP